MPGARCTRGLVCKVVREKRTRAYRFSGGNPAFPAQWFYGLCRALPGDEFVLSPSSTDMVLSDPGRARKTSADLTPATGARTTRFCRPQRPSTPKASPGSLEPVRRSLAKAGQSPFVCALVRSLTGLSICPAIPLRAGAAASTASHPASVTIAIRPSVGRDGRRYEVIWVRREGKYFCEGGWTAGSPNSPSGKSPGPRT